MGLASSQARLLLLTARKSDLEYRSQMISQRKIMLAMETEQLASGYTQALSNRLLYYVFDQNSSSGETLNEVLNYYSLVSSAANSGESGLENSYIVTDAMGRMVIPNAASLPTGFSSVSEGGKSYAVHGNQKYEVSVCSDVTNASVFQNALRNGALYLEKYNKDEAAYKSISWSSDAAIQDSLYTQDDAAAQAEYESKSLTLQNQDKMMDLELKQIETQHKAVETEYDSVKKVIDKNIEVSYKIFANG